MKLVGELKEKVEQAETQEEAKQLIEEAGMELTLEEVEQVTGGNTGSLWNTGMGSLSIRQTTL